MELDELRELLALNHQIFAKAIEETSNLLGPGAKGILYGSGKSAGKKIGKTKELVGNLSEALNVVTEIHNAIKLGMTDEGKIVCNDCPFREMLEAAALPLGGVICSLGHGYIAGILQELTGKKIDIKTEHAGPNACLLNALSKEEEE
ncbi:MAG: hypothetical protein ACFE68_01505 [Candidatus Hodarchaeota archaeon]